jgi:hypothetical protein
MYYLQLLWHSELVFNSVIVVFVLKNVAPAFWTARICDTWLINVKFLLFYCLVCCGLWLKDWSLTINSEWEHMGGYGVDVFYNMSL